MENFDCGKTKQNTEAYAVWPIVFFCLRYCCEGVFVLGCRILFDISHRKAGFYCSCSTEIVQLQEQTLVRLNKA